MNEGSLAIRIWSLIYDGFASLGIRKAPFIGVFVNVCAVALSGVVGVRMVRTLVGEDDVRLGRFTTLMSTCGLFWLFSALHLRDAFVLLATTALVGQWLWYVSRPWSIARLLLVVVVSVLSSSVFGYLRNEFIYLPIAVGVTGALAILLARGSLTRRSSLILIILGLVAAVASTLIVPVGDIAAAIAAGRSGYELVVFQEGASGSLAERLILNAPLPLRAILGSAYLFVFPIPFWSGLDQSSAYHLFKSANVIGFYFSAPLLALALRSLVMVPEQRTAPALFLAMLSVGFTLMIAVTSLETRHLGGFLVPMFVLCTLPDLRQPRIWRQYVYAFTAVLLMVGAIHGLWLTLKS